MLSSLVIGLVLLPHGTSFQLRSVARNRPLRATEIDFTDSGGITVVAPTREIERRRSLAIIAHPDAGKTTLTEKLLLYGGAVQQAGAVPMIVPVIR